MALSEAETSLSQGGFRCVNSSVTVARGIHYSLLSSRHGDPSGAAQSRCSDPLPGLPRLFLSGILKQSLDERLDPFNDRVEGR